MRGFLSGLSVFRPRLLEKPGSFCEVLCEFQYIPYKRPHNRLSAMFGANAFCRVVFEFPSLSLRDLLEESPKKTIDARMHDGESKTAYLASQMLMLDSSCILSSQFQGAVLDSEKREAKQRLDDTRKLLQGISFGSDSYRLLACNIVGALKNTFVYVDTKFSRQKVCQMVFDDASEVIHPKKPMLAPLRLSLFNSTGISTRQLQDEMVTIVPDISNGPIIYTDGGGRMSVPIAEELLSLYKKNWIGRSPLPFDRGDVIQADRSAFAQESDDPNYNPCWISMDLPELESLPSGYLPSAWQIRYKGVKGVLLVSSGLDGIHISRSMNKFTVPDHGTRSRVAKLRTLYVVGISKPAELVLLNSELIYLFESNSSNLPLLESFLKRILFDERVDCGGPLTDLLTPGSLSESNYMNRTILTSQDEEIMRKGLGVRATSQFLTRILRLGTFLPNSAHVYGVPDFSRTLQPHQVFLQVTLPNGKLQVLAGPVCICKSPSLFSSDLRRFEAIPLPSMVCCCSTSSDNPAVKGTSCSHPRDVVVFATRGTKAPPSLLSSADLDGDHFHIFYDQELINLLDKVEPASREDDIAQLSNMLPRGLKRLCARRLIGTFISEKWKKLFVNRSTAKYIAALLMYYVFVDCSLTSAKKVGETIHCAKKSLSGLQEH